MKIALFGGAFNPPHIGHLMVANSLVEKKIVDKVWFVPVFQHPWAERYGKVNLTDYNQRVEMLDLMIAQPVGDDENEVTSNSTIKLANETTNETANKIKNKLKVDHFKDVSFTYDTLVFFSNKFPEHEFSWVMGSEYLSRFDEFLKGHPKLTDFHFYIYPRTGFYLDPNFKKSNMTFLEGMKEVSTSSTEIKKMILEKQDFSSHLHEKVFAYIKEKGLYIRPVVDEA